MVITIETFSALFKICLALTIVTFLDGSFFNLAFDSDYLICPFVALWAYLMIASLSNFKSRMIKFYWKKEQRLLFMPYTPTQRMVVQDQEGNKYKLSIFFIPKRIN